MLTMEVMSAADIRDKLLRELKTLNPEDELYRYGYVDGVLDFFNHQQPPGQNERDCKCLNTNP